MKAGDERVPAESVFWSFNGFEVCLLLSNERARLTRRETL